MNPFHCCGLPSVLWPAELIVLYVIRGNTGTINKFTLNNMTHELKQLVDFD